MRATIQINNASAELMIRLKELLNKYQSTFKIIDEDEIDANEADYIIEQIYKGNIKTISKDEFFKKAGLADV